VLSKNPAMSWSRITGDRREYFISCLLAVGTGVMGLAAPGQGVSSGVVLVGVVAVIIVVAAAFTMGLSNGDGERPDDDLVVARRRRMAMLWYALAIVLAAARVRDPARLLAAGRGADVSTTEWILAALGAAVVVFAAVRVWRMLPRSSS
jgi:hypothetical protein